MKRIYLDWASAAPINRKAEQAFVKALGVYGNPSSPHDEGRVASALLDHARVRIARMAEARPENVIFTSGATEANNLAIASVARTGHVLYLPTGHASTIETIRAHACDAEAIPLIDGAIDLVALTKLVRPDTVLVVLDAVCGETGSWFDARDVRRAIGPKPQLHVDASQLPFVGPFELSRLGADTVTLDAQKVGGVRGIGALVRTHRTKIEPIFFGGGQEGGSRPGTQSPALAAAFAAALEEAQEGRSVFITCAGEARAQLIRTITEAIPNTLVNEGKDQAPHILNLSFPKCDTDYLVALLDEAGFAVSTKSACETDAEGSRVVLAFTGDAQRARSTLRISWGPTTRMKDLDHFAEALVRTIRFLDAHRL